MKYDSLIVSKIEHSILNDLMDKIRAIGAGNQTGIERLCVELKEAKILADHEIPSDVIRLKSKIDITTPFGKIEGYQLVLPEEAVFDSKKISIFTPLGSALYGRAQDDAVEWRFPIGGTLVKINRVYEDKRCRNTVNS